MVCNMEIIANRIYKSTLRRALKLSIWALWKLAPEKIRPYCKIYMENSSNCKTYMENLSNYKMCIDNSSQKIILIGIVSKNIPKYSKLTCLLFDNIGLGSPSYLWQWCPLTTDSGHEISVLNIALQTIPVRIFLEEFIMYVNQLDEFSM